MRLWPIACLGFALGVAVIVAQPYKPKHINRAIELLEAGQPIYYTGSHSGTEGSFEQGKKDAQTYADYISYDMEHAPFDVKGLAEYMRGLVAGGPTQERASHAGRDRQRSGERHRRSDRARQRLDVQPGARHRRPRHPADARRYAGRGAGIRRSGAASDPQTRRGPRTSAKAGAALTDADRGQDLGHLRAGIRGERPMPGRSIRTANCCWA